MSDSNHTKLSRRALLKASAGASALGILGAPAIVSRANAQSKFDWKRFAGEKIDVMMVKNPRADLLQKAEKEFSDLTGITVSSEQIPEQQQRQKAMIEFSSGRPTFDVTFLALHVQKRLSYKGKWTDDLRPMIANPELTSPDFDLADFGKAGLTFATQADGVMNTLPHFVDFWMLYYNKEIFQKKGVAYPTSMDEIVAAAAKLNDPAGGVNGFVSRGLKNANIPVWTSWLLGQGLETIDPATGKLNTDGPEAIWAAELYRKLNKDYAPPGTIGFNWNECQTTFAQGRAAMWLDGIGFATPLEDPTKSKIVGKVGYGVTPQGSEGAPFRHLRRRHGHRPGVQEEGRGLVLHPVGLQQEEPARHAEGRRGRAGAHVALQRSGGHEVGHLPEGLLRLHGRVRQDRPPRPAADHPGHRVPRHLRRGAHQHAVGRRRRDRAEEGDGGLQARAREVRAGLSLTSSGARIRPALRLLPPGPLGRADP